MTDDPSISLSGLPALLQELEGWSALRAALRSGCSGTIDGAWGSAAPLAVAALGREIPGLLLVVIPHIADLPAWAQDLHSFLGTRPALFPAWETWPPPEHHGRQSVETVQRLRLLKSLAEPNSPGTIVLAPIAALLQPVPSREQLASMGRKLQQGVTLPPEELSAWLVGHGYKRVDAVEYPGDFARRGGIVDLFPPDRSDPIRLEFFGDELESLRTFSTATQRSLEVLDDLLLLPAGRAAASANDQIAGQSAARSPAQSAAQSSDRSSARSSELEHRGFLTDHLPPGSVIVLVEPGDLKEQARHFLDRVGNKTGLFSLDGVFANLLAWPSVTLTALPRASVEASCHLRVESVERFSGKIQSVVGELNQISGSSRVMVACQTAAEAHRLWEVLKDSRPAREGRLHLQTGHVQQGFRLVDAGMVVLGSHELFQREATAAALKQATMPRVEARAIDSFLDLSEGDYVVHVAHGIGRFRGMQMLPKAHRATAGTGSTAWPGADGSTIAAGSGAGPGGEDGSAAGPDGAAGAGPEVSNVSSQPRAALEEHLAIEFREGTVLYVPASRIDLVQKYVGGTKSEPELAKVGGTAWGKRKARVAAAVHDLAAEMLQMQAMRAALPGEAFPPDSDWQTEFEAAFPYQETPDQLAAIHEVKADMQKPRPMDRLICGDVGYGKTEVAIRAVFKAIDNGKQAALLVPTTVLAEQHFRTFSQRFAEYPFRVEVINRFRSLRQQKEILQAVAAGEVDVVIGTHRLLSDDVRFKDLGLVVIDEEQRFGVEHKEKLKRLRALVHILTMTATPIPRTLHSSLVGLREISNLETPPPDRQAVETRIIRWDDALIRHAIHREMNRGGQVYFVHNRIYDIEDVAAKVAQLAPDARIAIGHGRLSGHELEEAMVKFVRKEADILVSTTIIESGVDIPNANTIFIDDADLYGLADLHQLRGRVGRSSQRAYAYMIVNPHKLITPQAQKRLKAIEEFAELGAGFKIALRDLEIRGAGNILGTEQSGHIAAVGYELYCTLLENAVRSLKNLPPRQPVDVNVDLPWPAYLPGDYVPGQRLRIEVYRRLSRLRELQRLADFRAELIDRYGPLPEPAEWLLRTTEVRLACVPWAIATIHRDGPDLIFGYRNRARADQLAAASAGRLKVVDDRNLYLRLRPGEDDPAAMHALLMQLLAGPAQADITAADALQMSSS